jgi:hypothetical protein
MLFGVTVAHFLVSQATHDHDASASGGRQTYLRTLKFGSDSCFATAQSWFHGPGAPLSESLKAAFATINTAASPSE